MALNEEFRKEAVRLLWATIGMAIMALVINFISWKFSVASGGMTGFALIANLISGYSVGTILLVMNTILLILSFLIAGKTIGLRGIYGYIVLSVMIDITPILFNIEKTVVQSFFAEAILAALAGILVPIGVALIIQNGYSIGNYTSIYFVINKFKPLEADKLFLAFDLLLAIFTLIALGVEQASLILINALFFYVSFKVLLKIPSKPSQP